MIRQEYRGKRALDVLLTLAVAPAWIPLGLVCAAAIKLDSRGPIFFRQTRVGLGGRSFTMFKLRSMVDCPDGNPVIPDDSRITRVGRVLRRWSLDELPQFVNVLRGEMSLVGPRPTLDYQVERYDTRQRGRLTVRPGLTGLAQVAGRNLVAWPERIELDLEYIQRQSPWLDLQLMALTPAMVLIGRGVSGHSTSDPISGPPT